MGFQLIRISGFESLTRVNGDPVIMGFLRSHSSSLELGKPVAKVAQLRWDFNKSSIRLIFL